MARKRKTKELQRAELLNRTIETDFRMLHDAMLFTLRVYRRAKRRNTAVSDFREFAYWQEMYHRLKKIYFPPIGFIGDTEAEIFEGDEEPVKGEFGGIARFLYGHRKNEGRV